MMVESYIALVLLALIAVTALLRWADAKYQERRRWQRLQYLDENWPLEVDDSWS